MNDSLLTHVTPSKAEIAAGQRNQKRVLAGLPLSGNLSLLQKMKENRSNGISRRVSEVSTRDQLTALFAKGMARCGDRLREGCKQFFEGALTALDTADSRKAVADMVAASIGDSPEAKESQVALSRMIAENVGKLIRFTGSYVPWYKSVTLGESDVPYIRTFVPQEINVRIGTGDGTLITHDAQPDLEDDTKAILFFMISDILRAKLFDVNKGNIADAALGTVDIALDLLDKIDAYLALAVRIGGANTIFTSTFVTDGTPAAHYLATSRINTANYPTGNIIAPASNGGATKPRFDCLRVIDEYFGRFASALDNAVGPVRIHMASGIAHQFGDEFTATSVTNPYSDALYKNRKMLNYNGRDFEIVPDDTIDPTDKYLYVNSGMPIGLYFDKPAGAKVFRKEDDVLNEVTTWERALMATLYPVPWAIGSCAVQFKT